MEQVVHHRRYLPHYEALDAIYFITFRLDGSLPMQTLVRLKEEREEEIKALKNSTALDEQKLAIEKIHKKYFGKYDALLDQGSSGPLWLRESRIAEVVAKALERRNGLNYELFAYCIMPNHVHLVLSIDPALQEVARALAWKKTHYALSDILQYIKGSTAFEANKIFCRRGAFWQHESYDHIVRDGNELRRIIKYVLNNPVKARLVDAPEQWKWSYSKLLPELLPEL